MSLCFRDAQPHRLLHSLEGLQHGSGSILRHGSRAGKTNRIKAERYGIQIDRENFAVFYDVFAENIMPQIDVVVLHE